MNLLEGVNNTIFILVTEKGVPFVGDVTFGIYDGEGEVIFQKDVYAEKGVIKLSIPPMHENDYYFSLETDEGYTDLKEVKIMKSLKGQDKTRKYKVDIDNERDNEIKNTEDLLNAFYIENGNRIKSIEDSVLDAETRRELQKKELVGMIKGVEKKVIDTHTKINTSHFNLGEKIEKEIEGVSSIIQDVVQDTNKSITLLSQKIDKGNEESGLLLSKKIKELKEKIPNSPILKYEVDDSKIDENTLWTSQKINKEVKGMKKRVVEAVNYGGGGASYFIDLLDAPTTYVGQAAKVVKVNATEDGLEFGVGGGGTVGPGTTDEIAAFDSANTITSLPVATYPSLTELARVKGVTSAVQTQLNAKIDSTYLDTDTALSANSDVKIATQKATKAYADAREVAAKAYADTLVVGLVDDRGNYDASGNVFPSTGGSGTAGGILKGDLWTISVAGTLGGHAVTAGDLVRALVDTPGSTDANWAITENNIGYVAENQSNKENTTLDTSTTKYPTNRLVKEYADAKVADAINNGTTTIAPSQNAVYDALALKADLAGGTFSGDISVPDEAYDATAWNGSAEVPTKNAIRDKIESLSTASTTETLTNKRITKRITTITSSGTPTINTDNCDCVTITALAEAITSMTTNLSGTPSNFDSLVIRIKDNGTARAITWGASFEAKGVALPTTTVLSKVLTVGFIYDTVTSKWGCVASAQEA